LGHDELRQKTPKPKQAPASLAPSISRFLKPQTPAQLLKGNEANILKAREEAARAASKARQEAEVLYGASHGQGQQECAPPPQVHHLHHSPSPAAAAAAIAAKAAWQGGGPF